MTQRQGWSLRELEREEHYLKSRGSSVEKDAAVQVTDGRLGTTPGCHLLNLGTGPQRGGPPAPRQPSIAYIKLEASGLGAPICTPD